MNETILYLQDLFMRSLQSILANIEDVDATLDNRDLDVFSDPWNEAYKESSGASINSLEEEQIRVIRKDVFLQVMAKTESSDLAAYLSDDFELICLHLLADSKNKWVAALCLAYFNSQVPQLELSPSDKALSELVKGQA